MSEATKKSRSTRWQVKRAILQDDFLNREQRDDQSEGESNILKRPSPSFYVSLFFFCLFSGCSASSAGRQ